MVTPVFIADEFGNRDTRLGGKNGQALPNSVERGPHRLIGQ